MLEEKILFPKEDLDQVLPSPSEGDILIQSSSLGYVIFAVGIGANSTSAACEMTVKTHTPLLCWYLPRARSSNLLYPCSTESHPEHRHLYVPHG